MNDIESKICQYAEMGVSRSKIAANLDIPYKDVASFIEKNNLKIQKRTWNKNDPAEMNFLKEAFLQGVSIKTFGVEIYNISKSTIQNTLQELDCEKQSNSYINNYNIDIFKKVDNEESAYWLGYVFADGCNQTGGLSISNSIDKLEHIRKFASIIEGNSKRVKISNNHITYVIHSVDISNILNDFGHTSPKSNMTFPRLDDEMAHHFIRGYLDGKSSFSMSAGTKEWRLSISGNKNILNNIIKYSPVNIKIGKNSSGYDNILIGGNERVHLFLDWIYKDSNIFYEDNYKEYMKLVEQQHNRKV